MWPFTTKHKDFYEMLYNQTQKVEEGLAALNEYMENPNKTLAQKVNSIEEEADELRRVLIDELNRTFVTPIDREDIFALSRDVDDVVDYAKSTVEEMTLFEIVPDNFIRKMSEALYNASKEINLAMKNLKEHPGVSQDHVVKTKKLENYVEHRYREGLAELFKSENVIEILKKREIYRHLSNAADRVADAADVLGDILVKIS